MKRLLISFILLISLPVLGEQVLMCNPDISSLRHSSTELLMKCRSIEPDKPIESGRLFNLKFDHFAVKSLFSSISTFFIICDFVGLNTMGNSDDLKGTYYYMGENIYAAESKSKTSEGMMTSSNYNRSCLLSDNIKDGGFEISLENRAETAP